MKKKVKRTLYEYIIIKEWIDNGEFAKVDRIVVVGTKWQGIRVTFLFKNSNKKIYYVTELSEKYKYRNRVKWIIFDDNLKKMFPNDDCNVLFLPFV